MNLGLPEIIIILLIIVVLFGVTWAIRGKRFSKGSGGGGQSTKDKTDENIV